jgi:hypothetical protein
MPRELAEQVETSGRNLSFRLRRYMESDKPPPHLTIPTW